MWLFQYFYLSVNDESNADKTLVSLITSIDYSIELSKVKMVDHLLKNKIEV